MYCFISCSGVGKAFRQIRAERLLKIRIFFFFLQKRSDFLKSLQISTLRPENNLIYKPEFMKKFYTAISKVSTSGKRKNNRKLYKQIHPLFNGFPSSFKLGKKGRFSSLHKVSGHHGNNIVRSIFFSDFL